MVKFSPAIAHLRCEMKYACSIFSISPLFFNRLAYFIEEMKNKVIVVSFFFNPVFGRQLPYL